MAEADIESDPEFDVQMTEEDFYEEVRDQLQNACTDPVAFRSIVAELESTRQAHSQKPVDLHKAIIRAIIELPGVKHQQAVSCAVYVQGLKKVLDKFHALLQPMKGRRRVFLLDASVLAGSLIKLLNGNKLMIEEWRDADKRNAIIAVLKDAEIVSEEQATKIVTLVSDAMFELAQELLGGTTSTVSEPLPPKTHSTASPEPSPDPGSGEVSAVFDHQGGRLSNYWSDDYLEIPKDAIPRGEQWRVSGFIHTSLDRYHPYADYDKGERLIAPVVRYCVEGDKRFEKLVKAVIHHSITCDCTSLEDKVSVLLQSESTDGKGGCKGEWLPHKKRLKDETAYFEVDSFHVTVYAHHFSNIICKMCDHEHTEDVKVAAMLFGRLDPDGPNSYKAAVNLYVCVQSALNQTAVFVESFHNQQKAAGSVFLGCECYPQSLGDLEKNDRILLSTKHLTQGWNILPTDNTVWQDYEALDYIPCRKQPTDPQLVDMLMFRGQTSNLKGMFTVSIETERRRKPLSLNISFSLSAAGGIPSVSNAGSGVSSEQRKLSDKKLHNIAYNISNWYGVGIQLDLSATELDIIQGNTCREHTRRKAFEMLRLWRDKNNSRYTDNELKTKLQHALESVVPVQTDAIIELNNDANRVQIDDDTIGDAVITQVFDREFFDEVLDTLQKACIDPVVFKSVVAELESTRQAHSQKPVDLHKAIIHAIIELPGVKHQQAVSCAAYVKGLKKVLDKFHALLQPMRGRRGVFSLDASVVAGSLIKLLKGNKLMIEVWRDVNKRNDIIEVLIEAEIVSEEQATRIIALVTDAMFPAVVSQPKVDVGSEISHFPNEAEVKDEVLMERKKLLEKKIAELKLLQEQYAELKKLHERESAEVKLCGKKIAELEKSLEEKNTELKLLQEKNAELEKLTCDTRGGVSSEPWKLPYSKLNYVAQMINNWYGVGLNLEILPNELDIIKANGEQKAFKMLRLWRDRNVSLFTENELKSILQHALEKMFPIEVEAIEELNNVANQDQVDVDASGDAFVTAVSGEGDIEPVPQAVDIRRI